MKQRNIISILFIILIVSPIFNSNIILSNFGANASALSYSNNTNLQFTLEPSITISVSGDLVINNLSPGSSSDSNIITVGVNTNAAYGYHLSATTGTSSTNTDLTNVNDNGYTFTNLTSNKASLSTFDDNYWGYSYSTNNGANWVSGSQGGTAAGYNGLPLDNNDQGAASITLIDTTNAADNRSIRFKIGAKASSTQASGTYTGQVNFYAVAYDPPTPPGLCTDISTCMQTMASCPTTATTVTDSRDGEQYIVQQLTDGKCWMLDNLRLGFTSSTMDLTPSDTNITSDWTLPQSGTANFTSSTGYTIAAINAVYKDDTNIAKYGAGSGKVGTYYNYCAASAGEVCMTSNPGFNATQDICPAGWRMPTGGPLGEGQGLATAITGSSSPSYSEGNATNIKTTLSAHLSGRFDDGSQHFLGDYGFFWSSTYYNYTHVYGLGVTPGYAYPQIDEYRYQGYSIRCILDS